MADLAMQAAKTDAELPYYDNSDAGFAIDSTPDEPEPRPRARRAAAVVEEAPRKRTDHYIWGMYIALIIVSLIELFSASSQEVTATDIYGPIVRHAQFLAIGLVLMLVIQHFHYKYIYYLTPAFVVGSIMAMLLVLAVGVNINGARRGLQVGSFLILPAELIKLGVALGVAWILSRTQLKGVRDVSMGGLIGTLLLMGLCCGLLFSHGLTNTLLIASIGVSMMLIGGVSWRKIGLTFILAGIVGGGAMFMKMTAKAAPPTADQIEAAELNKEEAKGKGNRSATWSSRINRHMRNNKYLDPITDDNKQEQFSYMAQAHGGLTGVGPGNSRENARLPLAFSDYILAIVIEEMGVVVAIVLLVVYLGLLARAGRIAVRCKHTFPCLLVIGAALCIVYQAVFHMAIVTGVAPVSGQPLPLISKGGTSIIVTCLALGIMLSVSRHAAFKNDDKAIKAEKDHLPETVLNENPSQL